MLIDEDWVRVFDTRKRSSFFLKFCFVYRLLGSNSLIIDLAV